MLVQAESGICSVTGTPEEQCRIGVSACDVATGMFAHAAVLQALYEREKTGKGKAVKASLFSSMADWMAGPLLHHEYGRSEEHTSELQSLMRKSYAVFCLKK